MSTYPDDMPEHFKWLLNHYDGEAFVDMPTDLLRYLLEIYSRESCNEHIRKRIPVIKTILDQRALTV
jgi:hypothetical protein